MQIIHSIIASDDECLALLELGKNVFELETDKSVAYSPEEKALLMNDAVKKFKGLLGAYLHEAFSYGHNEGSNRANVKDTEMYKPSTPALYQE